MIPEYQTIYCLRREVKGIIKDLIKTGWEIASIEGVTRGKVVLVARERFR
jgi:hypothetical protein